MTLWRTFAPVRAELRRMWARPDHWSRTRKILSKVVDEIAEDKLPIVAAGMAFYFILSILPMVALALSTYGLVVGPDAITRQLIFLRGVVPPEAWSVLRERMLSLSAESTGTLSVSFFLSLLGLVWAASSGASTMIDGVNIAYDRKETRSFFALRWLAIKLTGLTLLFGAASVGLLAVVPMGLAALGLESEQAALGWLRWPLTLVSALWGLSLVYRMAPNRRRPRWSMVLPGSVVGAALWLFGSYLFTTYLSIAGDYDRLYGSFAGIVVFMLWLYISAFALLLGAEVNAKFERRFGQPCARAEGASDPEGATAPE